MKFLKNDTLRLGVCSVVILASGISGCGKKKSTDTPAAAVPVATGSAVDDPVAQQLVVSDQVNNVVAAVSDGGSGTSSDLSIGNESAVGLTDMGLTAFTETRSCAVNPLTAEKSMVGADGSTWALDSGMTSITIKRTYAGTNGTKTFNTVTSGAASGDTEVWYPGPYFGIENIAPVSDTENYGTTNGASGTASLTIPQPSSTAAAASSGKLGSVGWRSTDGSWTGAPAWEVGTGYVVTGVDSSLTKGMVMYWTSNVPTVTKASTTPTVGGSYSTPLLMHPADKPSAANHYSILGQKANGALPSFQSTGMVMIGSTPTKVGQAGTIASPVLPAIIHNPPLALSCDTALKNPNPAWRFSQNVAGLTKVTTTDRNVTTTYSKGSLVSTATGTHTITWKDPALSAPVSSTPSHPYFDQNAGTVILNRVTQLGSSAAPNTYTFTYTPTSSTAQATVTDSAYTSAPLVETVTRDLNNSWQWVTKTIASGTINTAHKLGSGAVVANLTTALGNVVFTYNADKAVACVPTSGTITTVITPVDTTKQVTTIVLKFGSSVGVTSASGVTATVTCSGGAAGASNCLASAEADDADYKPQGCNF